MKSRGFWGRCGPSAGQLGRLLAGAPGVLFLPEASLSPRPLWGTRRLSTYLHLCPGQQRLSLALTGKIKGV